MLPTLYCVDIESTGVDLKNDRIIQIAFLKITGTQIDTYNDLCYTDIEMNDAVVSVHRITNAMLNDKYWPNETDSFMELQKGNKPSNYFISHGNSLDISMLKHEGFDVEMQCIDTDKCARILFKETTNYKLEELISHCNLYTKAESLAKQVEIENLNAHDALTDALWHYVLFECLLEKVENRIETLVIMTSTPMLIEKIPFGKFKNKTFEEVIQSEPLALVWMYANVATDWNDMAFTLEYWLKTKEYFWNKAVKEKEEADILKF